MSSTVMRSGFIGLQIHSIGKNEQPGSRVYWKNIRILTSDLKPSPMDPDVLVRNFLPNQLSAAEQKARLVAALGWQDDQRLAACA
jgi:hypothetical protein